MTIYRQMATALKEAPFQVSGAAMAMLGITKSSPWWSQATSRGANVHR